jgi:hypothetical protein
MTAEDASAQAPDPFARTGGRFPRVASWFGCTEGQLWSLIIGLLAAWAVVANGLPAVVWNSGRVSPASTTRQGGRGDVVRASNQPTPPAVPAFALPGPSVSGSAGQDAVGSSSPTDWSVGSTPDDSAAASGPLAVASGGYVAANAGTPLATAGVPAGSLAVAQRAGQPDKITYVRLQGAGPSLVLKVDGSGVNTFDSLASIVLCPVSSEDWNVGHGDMDVSKAPAYDCSHAVNGNRSAAGDSWSFDVTTLADPDGAHGFAILPTPGSATPAFQVVFQGA